MSEYPFFSIIIPVKNAAPGIRGCLESIQKLDYPQSKIEVILADGLSQDDTRKIGESYGVKIVLNPKQTVGPARNMGFFNSCGEYIVFTDADCILSQSYLKNVSAYFNDEEIAGISGPAITPAESSYFERAIKFIYELANFFCGSVHREKVGKSEEVEDIPGCNSIYRREILEKVMPVDENLLTAEDVDLNFRIRRLGYKLLFVPEVTVFHHRRSSPQKLSRQFYRFAIGRLQVGKKNIKMINFAHILAGIFLPFFIILFITFRFVNLQIFYFLMRIAATGLTFLFIFALAKSKSMLVAFNVILAITIAISSWSLGFMRELLFPLKDVRGK
ncbi:MAG: glycosyltransferase [Candidatus Omnitrophica bacterium]|nr:glycosyltransferase [Candidatus Omnitrophota bacterium]MBU2504777.1 glycosyltransferase [Candidatus Omnitrophota bacterium]